MCGRPALELAESARAGVQHYEGHVGAQPQAAECTFGGCARRFAAGEAGGHVGESFAHQVGGERQVAFHAVSRRRGDRSSVGEEEVVAFARRGRVCTEADAGPACPGHDAGFQVPLQIKRRIEAAGAQVLERCLQVPTRVTWPAPRRTEFASGQSPDRVQIAAGLEEGDGPVLHCPRDVGLGEQISQGGENRKGVEHVPKGGKAHEQKAEARASGCEALRR